MKLVVAELVDEDDAKEGHGSEREQHDEPPLELVVEVRDEALGGGDVDVEVEGGEEGKH